MYRSILDRVRKSHPGFDMAIIVCGSRGADASEVRDKMDLERRLAAEYSPSATSPTFVSTRPAAC